MPNEVGFPWSNQFALYRVILHELGHVYGNGHIQQSIMSEDIYSSIFYGSNEITSFDPIDRFYRLVPCIDSMCAVYQEKEYKFNFHEQDHPIEVRDFYKKFATDNFKLFIGRDPIGKIKIILNQSKLEFTDDLGSTIVELESIPIRDYWSKIFLANVFFRRFTQLSVPEDRRFDTGLPPQNVHLISRLYTGYFQKYFIVTDFNGNKYSVEFQVNGYGGINILYTKDYVPTLLFEGEYEQGTQE